MGVRLDPRTAQTETSVGTVQQFIRQSRVAKIHSRYTGNSPRQSQPKQSTLQQKSPGRESKKAGDRQGASRQRSQRQKADLVTWAGTTRKGQGQAGSKPGKQSEDKCARA